MGNFCVLILTIVINNVINMQLSGVSFTNTDLPSIPVWISNHMSATFWRQFTYTFSNFNGAALKFKNGCVI